MTIILKELKKYASAKRRTSNEWFFKTGKGQYGATLRYAIERMEEGKRKKFLLMKNDKI